MPARPPSTRVAFGNRLRVLRNRAGLTQEKLAPRAELDRSYVGQVERGEVNNSIENIGKLAAGLSVRPLELFEFADPAVAP